MPDIKKFNDTYVLTKILKIPATEQKLYSKIVESNNSQTNIKLKDFTVNKEVFNKLKHQLLELGFVLNTRQGDKDGNKEKNLNEIKIKSKNIFDTFLIAQTDKNVEIDIEKFLQALVAFFVGGYESYVKKASILNPTTDLYIKILEIIENKQEKTIQQLLYIYMYYLKAEIEKKKEQTTDNRIIPLYIISFIGQEYKSETSPKIKEKLFCQEETINIYKFYKRAVANYSNFFSTRPQNWIQRHDKKTNKWRNI